MLSREVRRGDASHKSVWVLQTTALPPAAEAYDLELSVEPLGQPVRGEPQSQASGYAVWVNPMLVAPCDRPPPNMVLILVDALRADHLGCYGCSRNTSPYLDKLSRESIVFEDATSQATWTLPSVLSMLTSSYPLMRASLGDSPSVSERGDGETRDIRPVNMRSSLQEGLQKLGYATAAMVDGGLLDPSLGMCHGFDWYQTPLQWGKPFSDQISELTERLPEQPAGPLFLFVHTYKVHNYYERVAEGADRSPDALRARGREAKRVFQAMLGRGPQKLSESDLQRLHALYDQEIRETDRVLKRFVRSLLDGPLGESAVIIITADHGEAFGEHGQAHHAGIPYRELSHVPLLIRLPDGRGRGVRVADPVALADLMPTLLELAGGEAPPGAVGRSLIPLLARGDRARQRSFVAESGAGAAVMARQGRWTYYAWLKQDREELYDVDADPAQARDLAPRQPQRLRQMRRVFAQQAMRGGRGYRLVLAGPREQAISVEIAAAGGFSSLALPTLRNHRGVQSDGNTLQVSFPAGDELQVVLFAPSKADEPVTVMARAAREPVDGQRFHLGPGQSLPSTLPVELTLTSQKPQMVSDKPTLPSETSEWGIWIWLPSAAVPKRGESTLASPVQLPEDLKRQLRALGYVE